MICINIRYSDFDGNVQTEPAYFNLTKVDITRLQASYPDGIMTRLNEINENEDVIGLIDLLEDIILTAYGVRSEDGHRFIKNAEIRDYFKDTLAYVELFNQLMDDENKLLNFLRTVFPKSVVEKLDEANATNLVSGAALAGM